MPDRAPVPETDALLEHVGFLRGLARSLVFDEGQADDVVQDALVVALRERPRHRSKLRAWLAGITRNLALKSLRAEGRRARREHAVARAEALSATSEVAARLELHRRVVEEVSRLPEPYRTALVHRYFDGLSIAEIAALTGVPPKTVETHVRRGVLKLRERMDRAFDGDRRAWCLGLVALVPFSRAVPVAAAGTAAAGTAAALTGVVMTSKGTLGVAAVLAAASFVAGWALRPAATKDPSTASRAGRTAHRSVPIEEVESLRGQLDAERKRSRLFEQQLQDIQREAYRAAVTPAGEGGEGGEAVRLAGPRFMYSGVVEALNGLDWDVIGESMSKMPLILDEVTAALLEGKKLEDMPDVIGQISQLNGPLIGEALKMSKAHVEGTGLNGIFTHPSLMVNMVHAALTKANMKLTEEQEQRIYEIGLRYSEEDRQRLAGYGEDALAIEKLVTEGELKDRFFQEMFGVLSNDQRSTLRPEHVKGFTNVDLFSTGLIYGPLTRPVPFTDRASLERDVTGKAMEKLALDASVRPAVEAAVRRWSESMSDEYLAAKMPQGGPIPLHRVDRVRQAARYQAALLRDLASSLSLTPAQFQGLRQELAVMVPYHQTK